MNNKKINVLGIVGFIISIVCFFNLVFTLAMPSLSRIGVISYFITLVICLSGLALSIIGCAKGKKKRLIGLPITGIIVSSIIFLILLIMLPTTLNEIRHLNIDFGNSGNSRKKDLKNVVVQDFSEYSKEEIEKWCKDYNVYYVFSEDYSDVIEVGKLISQTDEPGKVIKEEDTIGFVFSLGRKISQEELNMINRQKSKDIDYRDALRNPSNYDSEHVHWFGKVSQVVGDDGVFKNYLVYVNCEENSYSTGGYLCNDGLYLSYYGDLNLIEDDIVDIWGTMDEPYTYTTVLGASRTVPHVLSVDIELR